MIYQNKEIGLFDEVSETKTEIKLFDTNFFVSLIVLKIAFLAGNIMRNGKDEIIRYLEMFCRNYI